MNVEMLIALVAATAILAIVPGPVVAALVGRALFNGVQSTFGLLFGVFVGDLIWLIAAVSGLGYLAATYSEAFLVIKYIGAVYLIYLGASALYQVFKGQQEVKIPQKSGKLSGFVSGLFVTLGNPKLAAFYVGFLPTFINMETLAFQDAMMAAVLVPTTFCIINLGWALMASKARKMFKSANPLRVLNCVSGTLLIGAGLVMLKDD